MGALPANAKETFWASIGKALPEGAKVSVSAEAEDPKKFLDAMEKTPEVIPSAERAHVIFVDLYPEANWEHDCIYVYVVSDGSLFAVKHNWPPHCRHGMVPFESQK